MKTAFVLLLALAAFAAVDYAAAQDEWNWDDHCGTKVCKVCLISPGTDLPGEWALLALGSFPGLLRQTLSHVMKLVSIGIYEGYT